MNGLVCDSYAQAYLIEVGGDEREADLCLIIVTLCLDLNLNQAYWFCTVSFMFEKILSLLFLLDIRQFFLCVLT